MPEGESSVTKAAVESAKAAMKSAAMKSATVEAATVEASTSAVKSLRRARGYTRESQSEDGTCDQFSYHGTTFR